MLQTVKVPTTDLTRGMFVSSLDRPWLGTPFLTQGFLIVSDEDIERVRDYCDYVWVDVRKCVYISENLARRASDGRPRKSMKEIFRGRELANYADQVPWKDEHPRASQALDDLLEDITIIFDTAAEKGKLDTLRLRKASDPIVASISRNPDACLWLGRLKQHDEYSYQHSLSTSIWAVALGRQIGLHKRDLRSLAMGAMLMDVGKLLVDPDLLQADRPLTDEETREMHHHVAHGVHLVKKSGIINQDVIDMVGFHHERHDGSGYPRGLSGESIPPFARIAGLVDTYDAMTSRRSYADAQAPADAVRVLYSERDKRFQAEMVEALIQAIGIYPPGTIVELSTGEVGVVVAESRTRRLLPKVVLVLDREKREYPKPRIVDLQESQKQNPERPVSISRSLPPESHGINIARYRF
ncbi:HD-GYP domain-containing protein [Mangrovimicrobium sediminis]|uniref:HD-GYP domain-containing protein n=1 Tax=Mangrovimicrobium sediminis TaxID=2562682 RepID=A0A4Z0LWX0_9GAMM|nr:HD-GYP domain-containing protein [Haliea sp. SAOS-164]TGD71893.1 HD-GYP domain-containing protein [Haliea sp. SAOS-164]